MPADLTRRVVQERKASWQRPVLDIIAELPGSPAKGDRYLLSTDKKIYMYDGSAWLSDMPTEGWFVWVLDEDTLYSYSGTDWVEFSIHAHENKTILDLIEEALTTALKANYDDAYDKAHEHANLAILDDIEEALTTALKANYDDAYTKRAQYDDDLGVIFFEL